MGGEQIPHYYLQGRNCIGNVLLGFVEFNELATMRVDPHPQRVLILQLVHLYESLIVIYTDSCD
jgi:hypothetical protein